VDTPAWQEHVLCRGDVDLAWYEAGRGPTVVWINGGPGDDHRYLRPVAAPLADRFRCVLYDQRGCGRSRLVQGHPDEATLDARRFVDDLEALRRRLGEERVALVGHSWGATLALLYGVAHPDRVAALALVGLGPLDEAMDAVAVANLDKPLSAAERAERAGLPVVCARARAAGDTAGLRAARRRLMALVTRAWFASPEAAERFLDDYLALEPTDRTVNRLVMRSYRRLRPGLDYGRIAAPVLLLYGYQDFEPITQAYTLRERMLRASTRIALLNACGHVPWLEQPESFYRELGAFLAAAL